MIDPTYLIIGGANKSGTTSVFNYLSAHPQVCGSSIKETGFFIHDCTGDLTRDKEAFDGYFTHCRGESMIRLEASTGYLAQADIVVERIRQLLESPKLIFILRAPADRLYSYFNFHVAELSLPRALSFDDYVKLALKHEARTIARSEVPFDLNYLEVLRQGKYSFYLERFISAFGNNNIKLMLFEQLRQDPKSFMKILSQFIGINSDFYDNYVFEKSNTTYSSRSNILHHVALFTNRRLERILRQQHSLHRMLTMSYRRINTLREGYEPMSAWARQTLHKYYSKDIAKMEFILGRRLPDNWYNF